MKSPKILRWAGPAFLAGLAVGYYGLTLPKAAPSPTRARVAVKKVDIKPLSSPAIVPDPWDASSSDMELLGLARLMVARSSPEAFTWAESCTDPKLRQRLRLAVAQAWGEKEPADAVAWALSQNEENLSADLKAVLVGAVRQPDAAMEIGRNLLAQNSSYAGPYGTALIDALDADRQFLTAVQFAGGAPADFREDWSAAAARTWVQNQPLEALTALDSLVDEPLRDPVFRAVVQGWPAAQPADLATYALSLPPGEQRAYALDQVMFKWSRQDPAALSSWLANLSPGANYDTGAFFIVTEASPTDLSPALAMNWVQSIGDHGLRLNSFAHVLEQWGQTDPAAARNYVQQVNGLETDERAQLLQSLDSQ